MEPVKKKLKTKSDRFVLYSEQELKSKHDASINKNTKHSEDRANSAFQKFLTQAGKTDLNYWLYEEDELDLMLEQFWFGARKDPDNCYDSDEDDSQRTNLRYSANTMRNFRYSINRILKSKGHLYDIISPQTLSFRRSQKAFIASQKELKQLGKAEVHSAPEITEEGTIAFTFVFVFLVFHCENSGIFSFVNISACSPKKSSINVAYQWSRLLFYFLEVWTFNSL